MASISAAICKQVMESYPFGVIFSKTAPNDTTKTDYETDFCYYYFSPSFETLCRLKRADMCTGTINAKRDFPDYIQYFKDDIRVMDHFTNGKVYAFCEPWSPPGASNWVYTRKTAFSSQGRNFMLGCFGPVDEVALGIAKFKQFCTPASASPQGSVSVDDIWYYDAIDNLPNGIAIIGTSGDVLLENKLWKSLASSVSLVLGLFASNGYTPSTTSAAWMSNVTLSDTKGPVDVGMYGIAVDEQILTVVVLRPTMTSAASPRWEATLIREI